MPRKPRMFQPGLPCHVIQRGNNRQVCFFTEQDYLFYLSCLALSCEKHRVDLHAYVLMTNHVHLLMTPFTADGVSKVMQSIGRRYVQYINKQYHRTGTLFEGRFKASLVQADEYLLTCMRYIELNPVRANMVAHAADYKWSSHRVNVGISARKLLKPHPVYLALANSSADIYQKYQALFSERLPDKVVNQFTQAALCSMPVGNSRFTEEIEKALGYSIGKIKRGRPVKVKEN